MQPVSRDCRGVILISVLWIMVGLSLLALTLAGTVRTEATLARASGDAEQAYFFARGALEAVLYRMAFPDPDKEKQEALFPYAGGMNHYWLRNDPHRLPRGRDGRSRQAGPERCPGGNPATSAEGSGVSRSRAESIARSVVAWRTPGSEPGASAAPRRPYRFVEELLRVPGVSRELFHGRPARQEDGKVAFRRGLADFVTVYSGSSRINVNYAEPEVLAALPGVSWDRAQSLAEARMAGLLDAADLSDRLPGEALPFVTVQPSEAFCLVATARLEGSSTRRSLKVVVRLDGSSRLRHWRLAWYDETWPSPAVRRFSRRPLTERGTAGMDRMG